MPLPCLELTIPALQPLALPYSTVVTIAVCPHETGSRPQPSLQLLDGGETDRVSINPLISHRLYKLDNDAKKETR